MLDCNSICLRQYTTNNNLDRKEYNPKDALGADPVPAMQDLMPMVTTEWGRIRLPEDKRNLNNL